ncbi:oligosaccharide flippase family protein [Albidovulum sediminis]|uniref:Oligosaccharide flippase family protein n=1 Tax=Albidovulum sediminis TaxID=3066345 RepID=A0ABT2NHC3_9RHOB|nr:oligosaccharide flippase family protein [Defluviimonas sediminis]MCT8328314.1 oligosaccharide flippase family protein [Defluviimonas sediminis]
MSPRGIRPRLASLFARKGPDAEGGPSQAVPGGRIADRIGSSAAVIVGNLFGGQLLRLAGNLVLSRILFPEAFGLMTLVTAVIVGVTMFSDVGIKPSIQQSKRGDDQVFLDTAWTIQILRSFALWIACCLLSWPAGQFFNEPMLTQLLPVASFSLVVMGFFPTREDTASRHLKIGRVMAIDLVSQALGLVVIIGLAWWLRSVWAMAFGMVIGAVIKLVLYDLLLPGPRNRLCWEREARIELIHFGKWIFLSTAFSFLLSQSDKMILGKFITLEGIGIYNVGFFIAAAPMMIATSMNGRIMLPLCRDHPPGKSATDFALVRRVRVRFTMAFLACQLALSLLGVTIIEILYDDRFHASGGVVVAVALMNIPFLIGMTYENAAMASGDSRAVFALNATRAILQTGLFLAGIQIGGLTGAFVGFAAGHLLAHAMVIRIAVKHGAWDPLHDAAMALIGAGGAALALWVHADDLALLAGFLS